MNLTDRDDLRAIILERLKKDLKWKASDLRKDAEERGMHIDASRWTKYTKGKPGGLTSDQILWVCCRLNIPVKVNFGIPVLEGNQLKYEVPAYKEIEALKLLKSVFGKNA